MYRRIIASIGFVFWAGTAQAACSTANMAGKWTLIGQDSVCIATVQTNGSFSAVCSEPPNYSGNLTVTSSCKVSGTAGGTAFKGRTDPIPSNSALKPTLLTGASTNGVIAFTGFKQ
jgi:hypothetical protein